MFQKDFFKITALYTAGILATFYVCWTALRLALPEAHLDLLQTLTTAFGINLPNNMPLDMSTEAKTAAVVSIITVLSIGLVVLNVFFGAVVTARFIRPRVNLVTSQRGVLSTSWNALSPYVLIRMSNFYVADLVDVTLSIALTVEETHIVNGQKDQFRTYFPVEEFTPKHILVMEQKMPWSIAVPADTVLSNSKTRAYAFQPGKPITESILPGQKPEHTKRSLQILIQGTDARSYSHFVIQKTVPIDEQQGADYTLYLHKGAFKSLPLRIEDAGELEQYV